jgi:hypothetical protein
VTLEILEQGHGARSDQEVIGRKLARRGPAGKWSVACASLGELPASPGETDRSLPEAAATQQAGNKHCRGWWTASPIGCEEGDDPSPSLKGGEVA